MSRFRALPTTVLLGRQVPVATTRKARLLGLALLDRRDAPSGLLIPRCRDVHTFGMRFELDLVFLDAGGGIVSIKRALAPGRLARCRGADAVLELHAGTAPHPPG